MNVKNPINAGDVLQASASLDIPINHIARLLGFEDIARVFEARRAQFEDVGSEYEPNPVPNPEVAEAGQGMEARRDDDIETKKGGV